MRHAVEVAAEDHEVHVLAAQPNHYGGGVAAPRREVDNGVHVHRVWHGQLFRSRGKLGRGFSELMGALWMTLVTVIQHRRVDAVVVSTPPFFNSIPGWVLHRLFGLPLVVDLRDLWLVWAEESGVIRSRPALKLLYRYERSLLNAAEHITVATRGFKHLVCQRYNIDPDRVTVIYNGLDEVVRSDTSSTAPPQADARCRMYRVLYAGNLGPAQNLLNIIEGCADSVRKWPNLEISFVGNGFQLSKLKDFQTERLRIMDYVDRKELKGLYERTDAFLLHLTGLRVYEHTVPSKLFEYVSRGKPMLCGVTGEARQLCRQYVDCYEFDSDDSASFAKAVDRLLEGKKADNAGSPRTGLHTVLRSERTPLWRQVFCTVRGPATPPAKCATRPSPTDAAVESEAR
jgi:glycosyltransferase involved in cell wall biosynthesis